MRCVLIRTLSLRVLTAVALMAVLTLAQSDGSKADPSPFDTLLGSWRGSGQMELDQGRRERLKCNAYQNRHNVCGGEVPSCR
jgi:hypothetical protein